jgi:hypothetical protein
MIDFCRFSCLQCLIRLYLLHFLIILNCRQRVINRLKPNKRILFVGFGYFANNRDKKTVNKELSLLKYALSIRPEKFQPTLPLFKLPVTSAEIQNSIYISKNSSRTNGTPMTLFTLIKTHHVNSTNVQKRIAVKMRFQCWVHSGVWGGGLFIGGSWLGNLRNTKILNT